MAVTTANAIMVALDPNWPFLSDWPRERRRTFHFASNYDDGFEENADTNYSATEIVGRAAPYQVWVNNGARTIPITFQMQVTGDDGASIEEAIRREVTEPALWLDSLRYHVITAGGRSQPPPPLLLSVGKLFSGRVIATDVSVKWLPPFDPGTHLPHAAEVSTTFTEVPRTISDFQTDGRFRLSQSGTSFTGSAPSLGRSTP